MEVDVKIREVSSWEIMVLLCNEASKSNTSAAATWMSNPRNIRLFPPNPALFFGKLLIESKLRLLNLRQTFSEGKFDSIFHAFSFPYKRISSTSVHELFFHFIFAFLSRNVHFLLRRGSDLHTPPWQWLLVRWDINNSPPFLGHDLLHGFRDFLTLSCFNFFKDTIEFLVFCVRSLSVEK